MFVWDTILAFGLRNWKLIAVVLAIVSLISYIGFLRWEVGHYQDKYEDTKASFALYKSRAEADRKELEDGAAAISRRFETNLTAYYLELDRSTKLTKEAFLKDEELKRLYVSNRALELLNRTTRGADFKVPAEALKGNVSDAGGATGSTSLAVVFATMTENNANHLKCIKQVEDWQKFWIQYQTLVEGVEANASSP